MGKTQGILGEFIEKYGSEVANMLFAKYDYDTHIEVMEEEIEEYKAEIAEAKAENAEVKAENAAVKAELEVLKQKLAELTN